MYMNKWPGAHPGCICTYGRGFTYTGVWEEVAIAKDRERSHTYIHICIYMRGGAPVTHTQIYTYIYIIIYIYICAFMPG